MKKSGNGVDCICGKAHQTTRSVRHLIREEPAKKLFAARQAVSAWETEKNIAGPMASKTQADTTFVFILAIYVFILFYFIFSTGMVDCPINFTVSNDDLLLRKFPATQYGPDLSTPNAASASTGCE